MDSTEYMVRWHRPHKNAQIHEREYRTNREDAERMVRTIQSDEYTGDYQVTLLSRTVSEWAEVALPRENDRDQDAPCVLDGHACGCNTWSTQYQSCQRAREMLSRASQSPTVRKSRERR